MTSEIRNNIGVCTLDLADTIVRPRMGESFDPLLRAHLHQSNKQNNESKACLDYMHVHIHVSFGSDLLRPSEITPNITRSNFSHVTILCSPGNGTARGPGK